jgi:predicted outer membrane protein
MALTESKLKDLRDKKFDKLYEREKTAWHEMTTNAFNTARDHICEGRTPRHDDVLKMLMPMLEPNETLRKHQEQHRARFKHFREAFAEYLIDIYFHTTHKERTHHGR